MHRDVVTHAVMTPCGTDFLVTASSDGHVKFWKKMPEGVEFVKHYHSHLEPIHDLAVSYQMLTKPRLISEARLPANSPHLVYLPRSRPVCHEIVFVQVSRDGHRLCSTSADKSIKFYDVVSFDMSHMISLKYTPTRAAWIHERGRQVHAPPHVPPPRCPIGTSS